MAIGSVSPTEWFLQHNLWSTSPRSGPCQCRTGRPPCSASRFCSATAFRKRSWRKPSPHEESEEEHFWDGGSAPKPPRFSAFAPGFLGREASCARALGIPAPESALGLRLRRALPSAQVRSVYQGNLQKETGRLHKKLDAPSTRGPSKPRRRT